MYQWHNRFLRKTVNCSHNDLPSINVIGNIRGFLDFVACSSNQLGGWFLVPLANVRLRRSSQYGAYPGGPSLIKHLRYLTN